MGNINISIKKEAYDFLKSRKTEDKSFSDVILDFRKKKTPLDFFGILKNKDWGKAEKDMKSFRVSFNEKLEK